MAKAEPIFHPTPLKTPDGVILTLNRAEAECLKAILSRIGGAAETTRRKHADSVRQALHSAGFYAYTTVDMEFNCGIYFKDTA